MRNSPFSGSGSPYYSVATANVATSMLIRRITCRRCGDARRVIRFKDAFATIIRAFHVLAMWKNMHLRILRNAPFLPRLSAIARIMAPPLYTRDIFLLLSGVSTRSHSLVKRFDGIYTGPYFDSNTPTNITAQLGTHAYLPCKVRQLGNKSVSYLTM